MKKRPNGFLEMLGEDEPEVLNYIQELHAYLWRFIRCEVPEAEGSLRDYLDVAVERAEKRYVKDLAVEALWILETNCDADGNSMSDSDAANRLRRIRGIA